MRRTARRIAATITLFSAIIILQSLLPVPSSFAYGKSSRQSGHLGAQPESIQSDAGEICELEKKFIAAGLVNIREVDPSVLVELKYASPSNFMGADVYGGLKEGYMQRETAIKLKKANDLLKASNPGLRILLADGCRPRSVQRRMWKFVVGTPMQKYIANPSAASMHNYGAAVDVTIADAQGNRLDMGCPMDYFGTLSHPAEEPRLLKEGKLSAEQVSNRRLLREVMTKAGFRGLNIEWWHFNSCDRRVAANKYRIIE